MELNPYRPPAAEPLPPPRDDAEHHYVDQGGRVWLLTGLLAAGAITTLMVIGSFWLEVGMLERAQHDAVTITEADASDERQQLVWILDLVVRLVTLVVFAMFLVRTNKNARALSGQPLEVSPGWMVGWFFVPFLNLFKPYVAVREVWERSKGAEPSLLGLWWAAWILSGILGTLASYRLRADNSIPERIDADWFMIVREGVTMAAVLLALWMVRSLHAGQQRHHQTGRPDIPGL
jgi:heme/copper-type cytochrome/quinol oxidase subunit 2